MRLIHFFQWRSWSIRARLMVIAAFPVAYLFLSLVSYSYYARLKEVDEEMLARAKTVSTALAEGAEYNIVSHNSQGVRQMIYSVIQTERSIYRIEILDAAKNEISHVESAGKGKPEPRFVETPIKRQLMWVDLIPETAARSATNKSDKQNEAMQGLVGYVRVTMTASYLLDKQHHRFVVELLMSVLALGVSAWVAWYLANSLTLPLQAATAALRDISAGRTETQIDISTGGEIGALQASINDMAKSLHQSQQHLENTVAERTQELLLSRNEAVKADAEKRRLIHKVNSIVEAERQSIAIEIHDELNASLIAVRLESERISRIAGNAGAAAKEANDAVNESVFLEVQDRAKSVIKLALNLYTNGRNLVRRLRPEVLELMGLQGAVEEMVRLYNAAHGNCHFQFSASGDFSQLNADIAISAYRIVQEVTSNILKHAQASQVDFELQLDAKAHRLSITITDNGHGFDPQQVAAGIGISGMRERVLVLDGEFELRSQIGGGTRIGISVPV